MNLYACCANNPVVYYDPSGSSQKSCKGQQDSNKERVGRQNGETPRNNQAQNKQVDAVVSALGLNKKQRRLLHDEISREGYGYQEILEIAKDMFGFGGK